MIAIGIDFGTGNTVLSYWANNRINIAKFNGLDYISSDLLLNEDDKIELDPLLLTNPPSGYKRIRGIKRVLLDLNEISSNDLRRFANLASKRISFLYEHFVSQYGNENYHSVLTCPAHASQAYRELLLDIGRSIGLNELEIIDEPTAAAVHHGLSKIPAEEERLLVIDWGCGTCDVSLIERQAGSSDLNVIAVKGNNRLGGMDMDDLLRGFLSRKYKFNIEDCAIWQVEAIKIHLSTENIIQDDLILTTGQSIPIEVTRSELEDVVHPLLSKFKELIRDGMNAAHWKSVDYTIATGGPMFMPIVRRTISDLLGEDEENTECLKMGEPLTSVAQGAAKLAYLKNSEGLYVTNKVTQSIGIRIVQDNNPDSYLKIINRGETRPIKMRDLEVVTSEDLQDIIVIEIREGDNISADSNTLLGKLNVVVRPEKKGKIKVRLNISLSDSGALDTWVEPLGDPESVRQVQSIGLRLTRGEHEIKERDARFSDPVIEFQSEVFSNDVNPDTARQIYERLKIKYHPNRKPEDRDYWNDRLTALDRALTEYLRETERRMRASTLPDLPWDRPHELQKIVVDEILAQRLTHCLAQGIGGATKTNQLITLLKRFPDYRRVLAAYLFAVKHNSVLQELLAQDDRPQVGLVVLLQNLPDKPIREHHEALKAVYRLPIERVREILSDPKLDIESLYIAIPAEAPTDITPMFTKKSVGNEGSSGLKFEYQDGNTYITGNTYPMRWRLKQLGCRWDPNKKAWYATGKRLTAEDI